MSEQEVGVYHWLAESALVLIEPAIEGLFTNDKNTKVSRYKPRTTVHVVIAREAVNPHRDVFGHMIVAERTFGNKDQGDEFIEIARNKTEVSWTTGLSTRDIITRRIDLIKPGDFLFPGGKPSKKNGFVVGSSGLEGDDDELVDDWVHCGIDNAQRRLATAMQKADPPIRQLDENTLGTLMGGILAHSFRE